MRIAKDIRKILSEKWFMAGFGLAQEIDRGAGRWARNIPPCSQ